MTVHRQELDSENAAFWDELCGTIFARSLGITENTPAEIARFDAAYLDMYPYLASYVDDRLDGKRVLEIGIGYGTLGQLIAERGADYHAVDIAAGPVLMMRERLERLGLDNAADRARVGSALALPFPDESFDRVFSIGCLHHTGALPESVAEIHRVLRPGGYAVVMIYNSRSLLPVLLPLAARLRPRYRKRPKDWLRRLYDQDTEGTAAPHTEFTSPGEARQLFGRFRRVEVDIQNFPDLRKGPVQLPRRIFLGNLARVVGTDLYVRAEK